MADVSVAVGAFELDVVVEAERREPLVVVGPNGAGKTTLARALCGLVPLRRGKLVLDGVTLADGGIDVAPENRRVGVLFQEGLLFPHLDVLGNVAFPARSRGERRSAAEEAAGHWLQRLGIAHLRRRRPRELSGGEAQRVALARALAVEPKLLVLDEPLAAIDAAARPELRQLIGEVLDGFAGATVLISHEAADARALGSEVAVLEAGRVVQRGSVAALQREPATAYVAALFGAS